MVQTYKDYAQRYKEYAHGFKPKYMIQCEHHNMLAISGKKTDTWITCLKSRISVWFNPLKSMHRDPS